MADQTTEKTQKTQPRPRKKGKKMPESIEIPVPSKSQIMRDFEKIATREHPEDVGDPEKSEENRSNDPARRKR